VHWNIPEVTEALSDKPKSHFRQLFLFPEDAVKTPIWYPIAVVSETKRRDTAGKMIDFLLSDVARNAFHRAGFILK
jgi:ABC-type molybdate transport system substrate-binding protein